MDWIGRSFLPCFPLFIRMHAGQNKQAQRGAATVVCQDPEETEGVDGATEPKDFVSATVSYPRMIQGSCHLEAHRQPLLPNRALEFQRTTTSLILSDEKQILKEITGIQRLKNQIEEYNACEAKVQETKVRNPKTYIVVPTSPLPAYLSARAYTHTLFLTVFLHCTGQSEPSTRLFEENNTGY